MSGKTVQTGAGRVPMGQLSGTNLLAFIHDRAHAESESKTVYVVWSYFTPIAWRVAGSDWVIPDEKYCASTSRHQGIVRRAL